MRDLETRLRDGLSCGVPETSATALLHDVRRGVARRRARRATGAVVLVTAAVVATSIGLQHGRSAPPPQPLHSPSATCSGDCPQPSTGRTVDVSTAGDQVFRLAVHDGCTHCATVSRRTDSGGWDRLGELLGGSADSGPAQWLRMASDGRDGWAFTPQLWSTHDGGRTWTQVTDGPGRRTIRGHQLAIGGDAVWSVWTSPAGRRQLWRSPLGVDDWERVATPTQGDLIGVLGDGAAVVHATGEGASGSVVVVRSAATSTSYPQPFTSDSTFVLGDDQVLAPHGDAVSRLRLGEGAGATWQAVSGLPRRLSGGVRLLDAERMLVGAAGGWYLVGADQTVRTDLPIQADVFEVATQSEGTSWLVTVGGALYRSTDGAHWTPVA
jgi:hypothetical protein